MGGAIIRQAAGIRAGSHLSPGLHSGAAASVRGHDAGLRRGARPGVSRSDPVGSGSPNRTNFAGRVRALCALRLPGDCRAGGLSAGDAGACRAVRNPALFHRTGGTPLLRRVLARPDRADCVTKIHARGFSRRITCIRSIPVTRRIFPRPKI